MNYFKKLMCILMLCFSYHSYAEKIDWNDKGLVWNSYASGLKKLKEKNEVGIIVLYADWCTTCAAYSELFKDSEVIKSLSNVTLLRANAEEVKEVNYLKEYDEKYVPKTIVIDSEGKVLSSIHGKKREFMFFMPVDGKDELLKLISKVKKANEAITSRSSIAPSALDSF